MPPHYLITFLGTGPEDDRGNKSRSYREATYRLPDGSTYESRFVAEALWSTGQYDGIVLVGTMTSMWEEAYRAFAGDNGDEQTFEQLFEQAGFASEDTPPSADWLAPVVAALPGKSHVAVLEYGYTAASLERNVERLAAALQVLPQGAVLTLDITHGFRSQPFVALAALQSTSACLDAPYQLRHIEYGMLELARKKGQAEIVSLDAVLGLEAAARGAYVAQKYGRFGELIEVLPKGDPLRAPLSQLDSALAMLRVHPAARHLREVASVLAKHPKRSQYGPVRWVLSALLEGPFADPTDSQLQFALARWYFRQTNYAAATILLTEAIVSHACTHRGIQPTDRDGRYSVQEKLKAGKSDKAQRYQYLVRVRNAVAHANITDRRDPGSDIKYLGDSLHSLRDYFAA